MKINHEKWICDSRVAVKLSGKGILQMDYHGSQPVSRNSRIFAGGPDSPAFSFRIVNGKIEKPVDFGCLSYSPWGFSGEVAGCGVKGFVKDRSFVVALDSKSGGQFAVGFSRESMCVNVYGRRIWKEPEPGSEKLLLTAENKYGITDWIAEKGSYLVSLEQQKKFFKIDAMDDITFRDYPPETEDMQAIKDVLFINSRIHAAVGFIEGTCRINRESAEFGSLNGIRQVFVISFGDSPEGCLKEFRDKALNHEEHFNELLERYELVKASTPDAWIPERDGIRQLVRAIPSHIESAKLYELDAIRACATSYYWVWGWDSMVAASEMSKWGDLSYQRKIIDFLSSHRHSDGGVAHRFGRNLEILNVKAGVVDCRFILLAYRHYLETQDETFIQKYYPVLKEVWDNLEDNCDERGFIKGLGTYPDNPKAMGRTQDSRVAVDTGAFFTAAWIMNILGCKCGDGETASRSEKICRLIEENFLKCFFDEEKGMVFDSFTEKGPDMTYPVYSLIPFISREGSTLLMEVAGRIAKFCEANMATSRGNRAIPPWDANTGTECIHGSWFPYWDSCLAKLWRITGRTEALKNFMGLVDGLWHDFGCVPEFIDLRDEDKNGRGCLKIVNGSSGIYKAVLEGVLGIDIDAGGISLLPYSVLESCKIKGLHCGRGVYDFQIEGSGRFIESVKIDGVSIKGTYRIPDELMTPGQHIIEAVYSEHAPGSCLIEDVAGGGLNQPVIREKGLQCEITGYGRKKVVLYCEKNPVVFFNGKEATYVRCADNRVIVSLESGGFLEIEM